MKAEKKHGSLSNLRPLFPYIRKHWIALAVGFAFMILENWCAVRVPAFVQKIVDELTTANRAAVIAGLIGQMCAYLAVLAASLYLMRRLIIGVSRLIEYSLRERLYDRILERDYTFFQAHETGDLVSRTTNDLDNVRTLLGPGIMYIPNSLSMFVLFFPALFRLNGVLMLIIAGVLVAVIALVFTVLPRLMPYFRGIQESTGKINSRVWQIVTGIGTVKLFTMEKGEEKRFRDLNEEFMKRNLRLAAAQEFLWPTFIFVFSITQLAIVLYGGSLVIRGGMSIGQLLQFSVMVTTLTFPVLSLGWIMSLIQQGISAMGRINVILEGAAETGTERARPAGTHGRAPASRSGLPDSAPLSFEVRGLSFTHEGQTRPCLDNVNLSVGAGEFVGITGTIGSGKSTLVNVMTGLLKPPRGTVYVNGADVRDIEPSELFSRVGIVSQSPFLFSRTLAENIAMGRDGTAHDERVREAARLAGLAVDVAAFPDGYGQMLGERGITLSGGQKQRTAIARALMKDSPVVILDDSLSSVDAGTESVIIENLRQLRGGKTLIVVSHRISPIKGADRIYVLHEGRVVEEGSHAHLVSLGGLYERLVRYQQMEKSLEGAAGAGPSMPTPAPGHPSGGGGAAAPGEPPA